MKNWMLAYQVVVWLSAALFFDSGLALNRDARFPAIMKVHRSCPDMGGERECPYFPESW